MSVISTHDLTKNYRTHTKAEGLAASFKALVKPTWKEVQAVKSINLEIEQGELVAFIV